MMRSGLGVKQARRMGHDRIVWQVVCEGECMVRCPGDGPFTLMRCHNREMSQPYEALEMRKSVVGIKDEFSFFKSFTFINLQLSIFSWHNACQPRGGGNWLKYNT